MRKHAARCLIMLRNATGVRASVARGVIGGFACMLLPACSTAPPAAAPTPSTPPAEPGRPEHVLESFDATRTRACIRVARPADLEASLMTRPAGSADHFPLVTVKIYDVASDDVIVGYEPGCVVVHCGNYEMHGPAVTFVQRREVLRSRQPLEFELAPGDWGPAPSTGPRDLLAPTDLPPGRYPIWATFHLGSPEGPAIETPHAWYVVR